MTVPLLRDIHQLAVEKKPIVSECFIITLFSLVMLVVGLVFIGLLSSYRPTPVVRSAPPILAVTALAETSTEPVPMVVPVVAIIPAPVLPAPVVHWIQYHVQRGDTLERIARRYCSDYGAIARENGIMDPNWIYAGKTVLNFKNGCSSNAPSVLVKQSVSPRELVRNGGASSGKHISALASRDTEARTLPPVAASSRTASAASAPVPPVCASILAAKKLAADYEILDCIQREYGAFIDEASRAARLEPRLITAKIFVESKGNPNAVNSVDGSRGLIQLQPKTAQAYCPDLDWNRPRGNILCGSRVYADYLRKARGNQDLALVYWNAGPYSKLLREPGFDPALFDFTVKVNRALRLL